ncbi:carbamoyltransferase [Photorhabdus sp. RM71S]|uniref:carbamoyltransferase family protein n=1 Tax=Photorhabdus sp. RM71S TaxID=3342824 RepID=UPI0036DD6F92
MVILGISGLPNAQRFLRENNPEVSKLDERICQGVDSAACVIIDGKIVAAAAEERFMGEKGTGRFPANAINYCLAEAGLMQDDIQVIAHGFNYDNYRRFFMSNEALFEEVFSGKTVINALADKGWQNIESRFQGVDHHLAHAASAFYPSGFPSALCVISDGMGEIESLSVYLAKGQQFQKLYSQPISSSLGIFYSICTRFLGFVFNSDEYKVMGLAAYGNPERYRDIFNELAQFDAESGTIQINWLPKAFDNAEYGFPGAMAQLSDMFGFTPRSEDNILLDVHQDFAAGLQEKFTLLLKQLVTYWLQKTGETSLCFAGGSFLNCKANQVLCQLDGLENVFIQPASGDDGSALGAALFVAGGYHNDVDPCFNPYLGPRFSTDEVRNVLFRHGGNAGMKWRYLGLNDDYFVSAAKDIAEDKIIAWFHGRMEFGPRALGNRSILALPTGERIKDRINSTVKFREAFRPFAPAILDEDCDTIFETRNLMPTRYMLCTAKVKPEMMGPVSGIVHADGTARIQLVERTFNATFWRLLKEVQKITGYGCLVNTSFNIQGQPLIMSPEIAIETFLKTSLDKLYIEGFVVWKE